MVGEIEESYRRREEGWWRWGGGCMARCERAVSDTAAERYLMMEGGGEVGGE